MIQKLDIAASTIENLNSQLSELESNESLVRARQQHDSVVRGMQQRHQKEVLTLQEKLDELEQLNNDKVSN